MLILLDLLAALVVYLRLPSYLTWSITHKSNRLLRVFLEGFAAGLAMALILQLIPGGGEPSVTPSLQSRLTWYAVVGGVGSANTLLLYGCSFCLNAKFHLHKQ